MTPLVRPSATAKRSDDCVVSPAINARRPKINTRIVFEFIYSSLIVPVTVLSTIVPETVTLVIVPVTVLFTIVSAMVIVIRCHSL